MSYIEDDIVGIESRGHHSDYVKLLGDKDVDQNYPSPFKKYMTLTSMSVFVHEKSNISNVSQSKNTLCVKSNHLEEDRQRDVIVKDRNK